MPPERDLSITRVQTPSSIALLLLPIFPRQVVVQLNKVFWSQLCLKIYLYLFP